MFIYGILYTICPQRYKNKSEVIKVLLSHKYVVSVEDLVGVVECGVHDGVHLGIEEV